MNMCPSRKIPPESCLKGQVFFLWSNQHNIQLAKEKIPLLGGRVDSFLSREITTILIDDIHLAAFQYYDPVEPSYFNNPHILTSTSNHQAHLFNIPSTSQGFNFLSTSVNYACRIINYGIQWGIAIWGFAYFFASIDAQIKSVSHTKKRQNQNLTHLNGTFIKFECQSKKFRPCFKIFNYDSERLMPLKNATVLVKVENCKSVLNSPVVPRHVQNYSLPNPGAKMGKPVNELKPLVKPGEKKITNKAKPKEENNYCECCRSHYSDLKLHLKSVNHLKFVNNEKNYETVMDVMKLLPTLQDFMAKHQKIETAVRESLLKEDISTNNEGTHLISNQISLSHKPDVIGLNLTRQSVQLNDEIDMPLNLHVETLDDNEVSKDLLLRCDDFPASNLEGKQAQVASDSKQLLNTCIPDFDLGKVKTEPLEEVPPILKPIDEEDPVSIATIPESLTNQSISADVVNSAALAQLCLKNFDSYWLDSLPNEEKDIYFEDNIFDFDFGKPRTSETYQENADNLTQSAVLASSISSLQLPPSLNVASLVNNDEPIKDTSLRKDQVELDLSTYKVNYENRQPDDNPMGIDKLLSTDKEPVFEPYKHSGIVNPATIEPYKMVSNISATNMIDVESYKLSQSTVNSSLAGQPDSFRMTPNTDLGYFEKSNLQASCSNMATEKPAEKMFSDDSDDEVETNQNVGNSFISNVLNIITNSDNESKASKLNKVVAVSSDSGLKMDSKILSNDSDDKITETSCITKAENFDDFSNALNNKMKAMKNKLSVKSNVELEVTNTDHKLSNKSENLNKIASPFHNSIDIEPSLADSGLSIMSKDFEIKAVEDQPQLQAYNYSTVHASSYPINLETENILKAQEKQPQHKVIDNQAVQEYPLELNVRNANFKSCIPKTSVIQPNAQFQKEYSVSISNSQFDFNLNKNDFNTINPLDEDVLNLQSNIKLTNENIPKHYPSIENACENKSFNPPSARRHSNESETVQDIKYQSELFPHKYLNEYESSFNQHANESRSLITSRHNSLQSNLLDENYSEVYHKPYDQISSDHLKMTTIQSSDLKEISLKDKGVDLISSVAQINKNVELCDKSAINLSNTQKETFNLREVSNNRKSLGVDTLSVGKPISRDHTIQIPKKRYINTISKDLEHKKDNPSLLSNTNIDNYSFQQSAASSSQKGSKQIVSPTVEREKSKPRFFSESKTCKFDPLNFNKPAKKRGRKKSTIKPVKRKHSNVTGRNTRRKFEKNHSTSTSPASVGDEQPKMNLYTSYRISQSKASPSIRMPPKKSLPKLKKLPSVWRVTKIQGSGIRLRFTCIQHECFRSVFSCDEYEFNE